MYVFVPKTWPTTNNRLVDFIWDYILNTAYILRYTNSLCLHLWWTKFDKKNTRNVGIEIAIFMNKELIERTESGSTNLCKLKWLFFVVKSCSCVNLVKQSSIFVLAEIWEKKNIQVSIEKNINMIKLDKLENVQFSTNFPEKLQMFSHCTYDKGN